MNEPMELSEKLKYISMSNDQIRDIWISALDEIIAWCDKHDCPVCMASPIVMNALDKASHELPMMQAIYQVTAARTSALFNTSLGVPDENKEEV